MSEAEPILVDRDDPVVTLTLNAPPRNPIGMAMIDKLESLLPRLQADEAVRAVVVTGAGDTSFSVGANIKEFPEGVSKMTLRGFVAQRIRVLGQLESLGKPVIAAIRGTCIGGGLELALCCHFRIAALDAQLSLPEIDLGIVPAWGGTQRLTQIVGRARALDLMLRAKRLSGKQAHAMGLVHEAHASEEVRAVANELAGELASKPPRSVSGIMEAVIKGAQRPLEEGLEFEFAALEQTAGSRDNMEGMAAFFEKRKPKFTGG